jgi:hypothetical protein
MNRLNALNKYCQEKGIKPTEIGSFHIAEMYLYGGLG